MRRIAIAGGIGSGKSLVSSFLRELGANVVVADEVNAELLVDPEYVTLIGNNFPSVVHNNVINKKELADIVYHDEEKRRLLMELAHPRIFQRMLEMYPEATFVFYEIPLLSETNVTFDSVWFVDSDLSKRVRRIVLRDHVTEEFASHLISLQKGESEVRDVADVVIVNDGDPDALRRKVKALYCSILSGLS